MLAEPQANKGHVPVRPPPVLVPIISEGLKRVKQDVGEIGRAMAEAWEQMSYPELLAWSEKNFRLKKTQTKYYLDIGRAAKAGHTGSTGVKKTKRNQKKKKQRSNGHAYTTTTASSGSLSQQEYRIGLDLIDAGFRTLAKTMHPDKGGSQTAMATLNRVRKKLKTLWC